MFFKKSKNPKKSNIPVGKYIVSILDPEEKNGDICEKDSDIREYDDIKFLLCVKHKENKSSKLSKKEIESLKTLALYTVSNVLTRAYYSIPQGIWIIENLDSEVHFSFEETYGETKEEKELDDEETAEVAFNGKSKKKITISIKDIEKEISKDNNLKKLLFLAGALVALFLMYDAFIDDAKEAVAPVPPRPHVAPLTSLEKWHIKKAISGEVMVYLKKEIETYAKDPSLIEKRRSTEFAILEMREIPPVQPALEDNKKWVFPPGPRRGAIEVVTSRLDQQIYAGVGYATETEETYTKQDTSNIILDEKFLLGKEEKLGKLRLTKKCLKGILAITEDATPIMREDKSMEIKTGSMSASKLIKEVLPLIEKCPLFITTLQQVEDTFVANVVAYKVREPNTQAEEL